MSESRKLPVQRRRHIEAAETLARVHAPKLAAAVGLSLEDPAVQETLDEYDPQGTRKSEEKTAKRQHEHQALKALWESQAVAELLDEFLNCNGEHDVEGERTDLSDLEAQRVGLAVRVIRRGLQASVDHFAESW